jgi:G3E family GTPase
MFAGNNLIQSSEFGLVSLGPVDLIHPDTTHPHNHHHHHHHNQQAHSSRHHAHQHEHHQQQQERTLADHDKRLSASRMNFVVPVPGIYVSSLMVHLSGN